MNVRDYMLLEYAGLQGMEGRAGELCPSCKGGSTGERTLSVSRKDGLLLWQCHRASCQLRGAASAGGGRNYRVGSVPDTRGVAGRTIVRGAALITAEVREMLNGSYAIDDRLAAKHGICFDTDSGRLCMPVQNYRGELLGCTLRTMNGATPKTLTHTEQGAIAWYVNHTAQGIIIVEDQLSAMRASDYLTSVALLGTHLNDERVAEIRAAKLGPVYLALDADAWEKAISYAIKYRSELKLQLIKLDKDIKNQSKEELDETLSVICRG